MKFIKKIIKDIKKLSAKEIFDIGGGSFIQYFRNISNDTKIYEKDCINDSINNFKNYLESDEPKDHKLLIRVLMKCNPDLNILVLSETYEKRGVEIINTKLVLFIYF